jgi:hypothetical protein
VFDPISKPLKEDLGVIDKVVYYLFADESTILPLEGEWVIPVKDRYAGSNIFSEQGIDEVRVVLDTLFIDWITLRPCLLAWPAGSAKERTIGDNSRP